jgi:hypothetical protein
VSEGVTQYLFHDALLPQLDAWLASQGFDVQDWPVGPDDLPTRVVVPAKERG